MATVSPTDLFHDAQWRYGVWKSIYSLRMLRNDSEGKVRMAFSEMEFKGHKLSLPMSQPTCTYDFEEHFRKVLT